MVPINSFNTNSINTLFSSVSNKNGNSALNGIDFSMYNSIKTGSYGKLVKAYYTKDLDSTNTFGVQADKFKDKVSAVDVSKQKLNAAEVKNDSKQLSETAALLRKDSLWKKETIKDENGVSSQKYDTDKIYKAAKQFVDDYNSVIESAGESQDNKVLKSAANIVEATKLNEKSLNNIGITINKDNTLKIDEEKFKDASMVSAKNLFSGTGSFGQTIQMDSTRIYSSAVSQLANLESGTMYSYTGSYYYVSGSTYNKYL